MSFRCNLSPSNHYQVSSSQNGNEDWKSEQSKPGHRAVREILNPGLVRDESLVQDSGFSSSRTPFRNSNCQSVQKKEDACPAAVASVWIFVTVVTSRIRAGDIFSFSSRFPPISKLSDSEFLPLPSPRTYLCSTHSPCQLWKLPRARDGDWILSLQCNSAEPRPPHRSADNTHFQKTSNTNFDKLPPINRLDFGFSFLFILLRYEDI